MSLVTPDKLYQRDPNSGAAVPFQVKKRITGVGNTEISLGIPTGRKLQVVDWYLISYDTTASSVKLIKNSTDLTTTILKSTTEHDLTRGDNLDMENALLTSEDKLYVNASAAAEFEVMVEFVWTTE